MERRKVEGDENESKMGEEEYSCSLYVVSPEFELLGLKAKTVLRSVGAVTWLLSSHIRHLQLLTPGSCTR
jgi:hypothetical protein